jgi:hypothetical protein
MSSCTVCYETYSFFNFTALSVALAKSPPPPRLITPSSKYNSPHINQEELYLYMGFDSANSNASLVLENPPLLEKMEAKAINERDADLLYMWQKYKKSKEDSPERLTAQTQLLEFTAHCMHVNKSDVSFEKFGHNLPSTISLLQDL